MITELMFHPASVPENESREWLELYNIPGSGVADPSGWKFTKGISYTFTAGTVLPEGAMLVVAADIAAFQTANPTEKRVLKER